MPQCSGAPEGCTGGSWLAGFHAYVIENSTEATLCVLIRNISAALVAKISLKFFRVDGKR